MTCVGDQLGMEFSPQQIEKARAENGLLSLELELSRCCNLRCIYCYASSGQPLPNELTLVEIKKVVDEAQELGAEKIIVLGGGEPLLYPHLAEVIEYIREKDLIADLFTNGLAMSRELAGKLFQLEIGVVLKMNSRKPEVQDLLGGKEGTFAGIERALELLREAGYPDEKHNLGIETIICRQNYAELPDLWRWARMENIVPYVEAMTMQGRAKEHPELEVTPEEVKNMFEELARIDRDEFLCGWTPHPPLAASQCGRHEYSCTITATGDVQPCPGVSVGVGNIRDKSLREILGTSPVIADLRNIRSTIRGKCSRCALTATCYGCRGNAYQVSGDYLAEDPLCWL